MSGWTRVDTPSLPVFPAFAHAAVAGNTIYASGMIGLADDFSGLVEGGIGPQTTQALRFTERILRECGAELAHVVKVNVAMTDLGEWDAMNEAYLAVFGPHTPARIAVGCSSLLFGASVEFDCVAYLG